MSILELLEKIKVMDLVHGFNLVVWGFILFIQKQTMWYVKLFSIIAISAAIGYFILRFYLT